MKITNRTTKKQIMAMDHVHGHSLKACSRKLKDDEDVVLKFIKSFWIHFKHASDRLKRDREFIKLAIKEDVACFMYASDTLRRDKKFIIELIMLSNAKLVYYAESKISDAVISHLKKPAIDFLKNELKKGE